MILYSGTSLDQSSVSAPVRLDQFDSFSIQSVVSGSPVGTLSVEVSNDGVNWSEADSVPISGPINWSWISRDYTFVFLHLVYTFTSGSGSISASIRGRGLLNRYTIE